MKKSTLGTLYKRILPLLMVPKMEVLCKGRDGKKMVFFTYATDRPYPGRDAIYSMPCKDGVIEMHGSVYLDNDGNIDVDWWRTVLIAGTASKAIPPIKVDWEDPSWRVDRESLKESMNILKSEFELLKQTYEEGLVFLNEK